MEYLDANGFPRNFGSHTGKDAIKVGIPPITGAPGFRLYTSEQIKQLIAHPERTDVESLLPFAKYGTDQHATSACNGHMGAGLLTILRRLRGVDDGWVGSGAYLYSLINDGEDRGSGLAQGMVALMRHGTTSQILSPWDHIFSNQQSAAAKADAANHKLLGGYHCTSEAEFWSSLADGKPCGVCVHVGRNFKTIDADGVAGVDEGVGNHAVLALPKIRYNTRRGRYECRMRNSWGSRFGDNGHVWLHWGHFKTPFRYHDFYTGASSVEGA